MGLVAIIGFWGYSFFSERVIEQENNLKNYRQANICQADNCRRIVDATVLSAKTEYRIHIFLPRYRDTPLENPDIGSDVSLYLITLSLPDSHPETIKIYPDQKYPFILSFPNIYLPTGITFVDDNLPSGEIVKVEIWDNQVTFLLLNSVQGYTPNGKATMPIVSGPNTGPRVSTNTIQTRDYSNKIAIPTNYHPVISLANSKNELEIMGRSSFIAFLLIPIFVGLFLNIKK